MNFGMSSLLPLKTKTKVINEPPWLNGKLILNWEAIIMKHWNSQDQRTYQVQAEEVHHCLILAHNLKIT